MSLLLAATLAAADVNRALVRAAGAGDVAQVRQLLGQGADPNYSSGRLARWTPLMAAAEGGHVAVVRVLLERGADPRLSRGGGVRARNLTTDQRIIDLLDGKAKPESLPLPFATPRLEVAEEPGPLEPAYSVPEREDDAALIAGNDDVRSHLRALGVPRRRIRPLGDKRLRRKLTADSTLYVYAEEQPDLEALAKLGAGRVLVLLDAPAPRTSPKGVTVLAAASPAGLHEPGLFTRALLEGLNALPEATVERLYLHVRARVQRQTRGQTPRLVGDGSWRLK